MICLLSLSFSHQRKKEMSLNCREKKTKKQNSKHQYVHMDTTIKRISFFVFSQTRHLNFVVLQAQTSKTTANRTQMFQSILMRIDKYTKTDKVMHKLTHLFDFQMMPNERIAFQKTFPKKRSELLKQNKNKKSGGKTY